MSADTPYPSEYNRPHDLWQSDDATNSRRLSLRGRRGAFAFCVTALTMGLLLVGFWQPWRHQFISPGPLTPSHAQALAGTSEAERCNVCHEAANLDPVTWMLIETGRAKAGIGGQAEKCLACHGEAMKGELALNAHNVAPEQLVAITSKRNKSGDLSDFLRVKRSSQGELACATCHREHHGMQLNMASMTNQQCQTCHANAIHNFETNHPEFGQLPQQDRQIAFDHVAHSQKHFPDKQTAFACNQCHVDDDKRNVKRLAGFEQSCAKCHTQPIKATTVEGIVAFSLPTLDVTKLKNAGQEIGEWPSAATGDFDGALPPLVRALLMADDEAAHVLNKFAGSFDFQSVDGEDAASLRQIATLAKAYKRLLAELARDSRETFQRRFTKLRGHALSEVELNAVLQQLPRGLFLAAAREWFPKLDLETNQSPQVSQAWFEPEVFRSDRADAKSELLAENPLALRYGTKKPEVSETQPEPAKPSELPKPAHREISEEAPKSSSGELLAENPLKKEQTPAVTPAVPDKVATAPVEPSPPPTESVPEVQPVEPAAPVTSAISDPEDAWHIDSAALAIRYRPIGHADPMLRLLLNAAAESAEKPAASGLLASVVHDSGAKSCTNCHSFEGSGGKTHVNWDAAYRDPSVRSFTEFSHRPHLVQPSLRDCNGCHQLNTSKQLLASDHPLPGLHDFLPLQKSSCVSCHTTENAGSQCTLCHSYHVGAKRGGK